MCIRDSRDMVAVLTRRALMLIRDGRTREGWAAQPITLGSCAWPTRLPADQPGTVPITETSAVHFTLNGRPATVYDTDGKTLLDVLRATPEAGGGRL